MEKDEEVKETVNDVSKNVEKKQDNIKSSLSLAQKVKRVVQIGALIALIPLLYVTIASKGFSEGWYYDVNGVLRSRYLIWDEIAIADGWFKSDYLDDNEWHNKYFIEDQNEYRYYMQHMEPGTF